MSYRVRHYSHKSTEQKAIENLLKGLWWLISWPFKRISHRRKTKQPEALVSADKEFIQKKWLEIDQLMELGRPSNYAKAVLEADKLLDHVLKSFRAPGTTMADRLKASRKKFSDEGYNAAWRGHIIRNELVHNAQFELMSYNAQETIKNYQKAIDELIK